MMNLQLKARIAADPNVAILVGILERHLGLDADSLGETTLNDCPCPSGLEPWEKAHVIAAIAAGAIGQNCLAYMLLTGSTHQEAHAASDRAIEISKAMHGDAPKC